MKKIIVDTNVFLRFLLNDIPKQKNEVEKLLYQAKKSQIVLVVPEVVIFELNYILLKYYAFEKTVIIERLNSLVRTKYLRIESRQIFIKALVLYKIRSISLADSFLLAKAELEEAELFTFDKKLLS